jgi:hypothetical protein
MKSTLLILALLTFFTSEKYCKRLKDGAYLIKHTFPNGVDNYRLIISGDTCNIQINDTLHVKGKVKWIDDCSLKLEPEAHAEQDTTELARKVYQSFGEPFIEMKTSSGDTTFFRTTWTHNLHVTINEGYFLRVR